MRKVLVLGDCNSAGTNTLLPKIGQKENFVSFIKRERYPWPTVTKWFLETGDLEPGSNVFEMPFRAKEYLVRKELENSYFKHILHPVVNMSKVGATAYGYFLRLKKYEEKYGTRPDCILLTDHTPNHNWQRINYNGHKYFFEKIFDPDNPDFMYNPVMEAPEDVQRIAHEKSKYYYENKKILKRNKKVMSWLIKYLKKENYNVIKIKFYNIFDEFNDTCTIDCNEFTQKYETSTGVDISIQNSVSKQVAMKIVQSIDWLN